MEKLIVAVDGTPADAAALDWAVGHARAGDSIEVTSVFDPLPAESVFGGAALRQAHGDLVTASVERVVRSAAGTSVSGVLRTGHPRVELVAASTQANLLVIATGSREAADSRVLPVRVASAAHCPVAVIPAGWGASGRGVVVGLESTEPRPAVIDFAAALADRGGVPLTIVQAWTVSTLAAVVAFAHPGVWSTVQQLHTTSLAASLDHVRAAWPGLELHGRLVEGPVARVLADESEQAAVLVVGRHGHPTVGDALLGTTSHELLLSMTRPVIVVAE